MTRLALLLFLFAAPALAETRVVDGDTLNIDGERVRIVGLDTPETWKPKCLAEKMLGERATREARRLVPYIERIERRGKDRWGRTLARVYLREFGDWAEHMIGVGLAVPFECPDGKCPAMTRWCG